MSLTESIKTCQSTFGGSKRILVEAVLGEAVHPATIGRSGPRYDSHGRVEEKSAKYSKGATVADSVSP